ncbi:hypothetical protein LY474_18565 [Myxococcus stipitatus]|uniref:hypothetical protein n=1 Tax=Myxococcus stipitatus TaxID=83455 RepID=UPI001F1EC923|nr:hypothetical protein [Myxococcus stipitatus]MCE9669804.1 hypothetical protein [Myxococcus stipitatus]
MSRTWSMVAAVLLAACGTQGSKSSQAPGPEAAAPEETREGELEVRVVDTPSLEASYREYFLVEGRERRPVEFAGRAPEGLVSGDRVKVTGRQAARGFVARSVEVERREVSASSGAGTCGTTGVQRTLVILVDFPGQARPAWTPQAMESVFFATQGRSLNNYWNEVSEGRTSATGSVTNWYTLDRAYSCNEANAMRDAAIQAAAGDVDFTQFNRIFVVHPNPPTPCYYAGLATLSCSSLATPDGTIQASSAWIVGSSAPTTDKMVELLTHEAGHNLSLDHGRTRDFGTEPLSYLGRAGTWVEYGDNFSTMGYWNLGHYAAPHKARIGWLSSSQVTQVDGVGGTFTLAPVEGTGGVKALKVRRGNGNDAWLWLEYRQPLGIYDGTLSSQVFGGALIHYEDSLTGGGSNLVDFTATESWFDPALPSGQTWNDPYSNLSVTVGAATPAGLPVTVQYRPSACVRAEPRVVASTLEPVVNPGARPIVDISITNRDSSGCAPSTFQLARIITPPWSADPLSAQRTIAAASTVEFGLQYYTPYSAPFGEYLVGVDVTRDGLTVSGATTIDVVAPCVLSAPTLTFLPQTVTATAGSDVTFSVYVKNNDSATCWWAWYDFLNNAPADWPTTFSDYGVNLPPGGDFSFTLTKSIPPNTTPGSYVVDFDLFKDEYGFVGHATSTVNVVAGTSRR